MRGSITVAVGFVLAMLLLPGFSPAAAQEGAELEGVTIQASTPTGNRYVAGRPVVITVSVRSTAARSGTIRLTSDGFGVLSTPLEVPGGSTKTVHLIMPTPPWSASVAAQYTTADGTVREPVALTSAGVDQLVGVLPDAAALGWPESAELSVPVGRARFSTLDPAVLTLGPDALALYTQIVATPADLDALDPASRDVLVHWVTASGGRLVVASAEVPTDGATPTLPLGLEVSADLPVEAAVGAARPVRSGRGSVQYLATGAVAGGADGLLGPYPVPSGLVAAGLPTAPTLAYDAQVSVPEILTLVSGLLAYTVVAAVLWLGLRRSRREPLLWVVLPALAVVATAGVYGVGRFMRSDNTSAHATVVADLPGARSEQTAVLVTAPTGGDRGIRLAEGWGEASRQAEIAQWGPGTSAEPEHRGDELVLDLPSGGVGTVGAARLGPAVTPSWEITFGPGEDGGMEATLVNTTPYRLQEVSVLHGAEQERIGTVEPGASATVSVDAVPDQVLMGDDWLDELSADHDPWSAGDGVVNPGIIDEWVSAHPESRRADVITVVGWTQEPVGPLVTLDGATVEAGRTAFLTTTPVPGPPPVVDVLFTDVEVRAENRPDDAEGSGACLGSTSVARWAVPVGEGPYRIASRPGRVIALDVMVGRSWVPTGYQAGGGAGVPVPDGAVIDGYVYGRFALDCEAWGLDDLTPTIEVADG
ncbi:MAG: hypothetical protein ACK5PP_05755 [Acidimicrobiales bacterium]